MAENKMTEDDQRYIDEMNLYIRQKEISLEHSELLIKQCHERMSLDRKLAEVQKLFVELDIRTIEQSKKQLEQFIKERS